MNRYRFALAHELGHWHLYRELYAELKFASVSDWMQFQTQADETDYGWLEYRAYAFAGLVLVPTGHLKTQFQSAANAAETIGFSRQDDPEAFFEYVSETLREISRPVFPGYVTA